MSPRALARPTLHATMLRVSQDREHGFQTIVSRHFAGS
jgi:hypothetical protein